MQHPSQQSELDSSLIAHSFGRFRHQECYHAGALCLLGFCCRYLPHSPAPASSNDPAHHSGSPVLALWIHPPEMQQAPKRHGIDQSLWPLPPVSYPRHHQMPGPTCLLPNKKRRVLGSLLHLCLPWACGWTTTAFVWQSASTWAQPSASRMIVLYVAHKWMRPGYTP